MTTPTSGTTGKAPRVYETEAFTICVTAALVSVDRGRQALSPDQVTSSSVG